MAFLESSSQAGTSYYMLFRLGYEIFQENPERAAPTWPPAMTQHTGCHPSR